MPLQQRLCAVITDEMAIKSSLHFNESKDQVEGFENHGKANRTCHIASHASVFMVRGLLTTWKQAFGYFFSSGTMHADRLKTILIDAVRILIEIGLHPVEFICDQGSNNTSMLTKLGVTTEKPYFMVDDNKVFVAYDPPHLLKNIRNNFKDYGFISNGNNIKWSFVEQLYAYDTKTRQVCMCPRLTYRHVYLAPFSKIRVCLAAQVLSYSVAAALETMVENQHWSDQDRKDALDTALFVENMDRLFNAFNSKTLKISHPMKRGITPKSHHFAWLEKCMDWLTALQRPREHGYKTSESFK